MKLVYRPHPADDRVGLQEKMPEIHFSPKGEKLEESLKIGDIFISFSSTSLLEAAMRSRVALQLLNFPLKSYNFEKLGICTASFTKIMDLEKHLKKIAGAQSLSEYIKKFDNYYADTRYDLSERFSEILKKIKKTG